MIINNKTKYECKSLGCRNMFDCPMQLARHSKRCSKPQPVEEKKKYFQKDGIYICCQCNKECTHQPDTMRHFKKCDICI